MLSMSQGSASQLATHANHILEVAETVSWSLTSTPNEAYSDALGIALRAMNALCLRS